ncbi:MAG: lipid asymmetry maintenance protein MlaB [Arsenophonus sp. ET-DL9-MAG3]
MIHILSWEKIDQTLILIGKLDHNTLTTFWQQRNQILKDINIINISKLYHIDSSGLAMFVRLKSEQQSENKLIFNGISKRFETLIKLYKLESFIN